MEQVLSQGMENQAPVEPASIPQEKMLSQSEVNEIVGRAKHDAAAKAAERAVEEYKRSQQNASAQSQYQPSHSADLSEDRVRRMAGEEAQRLRDQWLQEAQQKADEEAAQRIVKTFYDKIETGKSKYQDFENVTSDIELRRFPNTVQILAEYVENSADVLYELSKNRSKLAQIEMVAERYPREAIHEIKRLADSIKSNEQANTRDTNTPLNQTRPSNVGTDSSSVLSMRDLKNKYRA